MPEAADAGLPPPESTKPLERPGVAELKAKVEQFFVEPDQPGYKLPYQIITETGTKDGITRTTKAASSNGIQLARHEVRTNEEGETTFEDHTLHARVGHSSVDAHVSVISHEGLPTQIWAVLPDADDKPVSRMENFTDPEKYAIKGVFGIELGPNLEQS